MPAIILDGNKIAADIKKEAADEVRRMRSAGTQPGLAVVIAGDDPASNIYVRNKVKACEELGIHSEKHALPESVTTDELLELVQSLNQRDEIDGVLVQLPLPKHVDHRRVLTAVDPLKDVDGFHPVNVGNLATGRPGLFPCTPLGIMEILRRENIRVEGAEAVVVGRSEVVGKPISMMLLNQSATVSICHSKTRNLPDVCRRADILVAAIGRPGMITRDFVKPGATVIDVGINRVTDLAEFERFFSGDGKRRDSFEKRGSTLVGDVHPDVAAVAGAITPVPGGVGLLTVAMLIVNTLKACKTRRMGEVAQAERA
ncbi:MAG TPA: bifunctional methylenetetrahydrofolate dehydrogenase/methenyltetrahydrofolate cyclohydrolase FolD [Terriglobales bacterium]|nr:bifunctional methylenetetrahydrofolate dehydrogenase/methenyltetrahydrofolate cyclohydrolase FolD [Terriglobales bacterium]